MGDGGNGTTEVAERASKHQQTDVEKDKGFPLLPQTSEFYNKPYSLKNIQYNMKRFTPAPNVEITSACQLV